MEVSLFERESESTIIRPLFSETIHAGFESPATDYEEERIDLNEYVSNYKHATFYARVEGTCMTGSGIHPNDLLVVDRSLVAQSGDVVVGKLNNEFILRVLLKHEGKTYLMPDNADYEPICIVPEMEFQIWGVVPHTILNQRIRKYVRIDRLQQLLRKL